MTYCELVFCRIFLYLIIIKTCYCVDIKRGQNPFCFPKCERNNVKVDTTVCLLAPCNVKDIVCEFGSYPMPLESIERRTIAHTHNLYRNSLPSKYNLAAADMCMITYSDELEFAAQCHLNSGCEMRDPCNLTPRFNVHVGQNVYKMLTASIAQPLEVLRNAVKTWAQEVKLFTKESISKFEFDKDMEASQLLWSRSRYVGCGRIMKQQFLIISCFYGPGGNIPGEPIYEIGDPCTKCPFPLTCNTQYTQLCGVGYYLDWEEPFVLGKSCFTKPLAFLYPSLLFIAINI